MLTRRRRAGIGPRSHRASGGAGHCGARSPTLEVGSPGIGSRQLQGARVRIVSEAVLAALHRIAPEADLTAIRPGEALRDQLDLDSVDFLEFVVDLHETLGIDVPETDSPRVRTLDDCVRYLEARRPPTA